MVVTSTDSKSTSPKFLSQVNKVFSFSYFLTHIQRFTKSSFSMFKILFIAFFAPSAGVLMEVQSDRYFDGSLLASADTDLGKVQRLCRAIDGRHRNAAFELISQGANPQGYQQPDGSIWNQHSPLYYAIDGYDDVMVKYLLDLNVEFGSDHLLIALMNSLDYLSSDEAARAVTIVHLLLDAGAIVNPNQSVINLCHPERDFDNRTPVHTSAASALRATHDLLAICKNMESYNQEAVQDLLQRDASVMGKDKDANLSALMMAFESGNVHASAQLFAHAVKNGRAFVLRRIVSEMFAKDAFRSIAMMQMVSSSRHRSLRFNNDTSDMITLKTLEPAVLSKMTFFRDVVNAASGGLSDPAKELLAPLFDCVGNEIKFCLALNNILNFSN